MSRRFGVSMVLSALLGVAACDGGKKPATDGPAAPGAGDATPQPQPPAPAQPDAPAQPTPPAEPDAPAEPVDCDGTPCAPPRQCLSYYGIAGPSGPEFHACEIPCKPGSGAAGCPDGMSCITVADGPGSICRETDG